MVDALIILHMQLILETLELSCEIRLNQFPTFNQYLMMYKNEFSAFPLYT